MVKARHKKYFFILIIILLPPIAWSGYIAWLTVKNDRAYSISTPLRISEISLAESEIQKLLDDYSIQHHNVGLQATIILSDSTVWNLSSGYANQRKQCFLTSQHHVYVGSITKLYTASMIMFQVEKGTFSLDDHLDKWVDLPYANRITLRMLLNHTSGIPNFTESAWFLARLFGLPQKQWLPDELFRVIASQSLEFEPGSQHRYSNSNYVLLGIILERATGKSYQELLEETLLTPLHLQNTFALSYPDEIAIANGYDISLLHLGVRNLTAFRHSFESGAFSAGSVLSTSEDVALFLQALFTSQLVADTTLAQMETFVHAPDEDVPLQTGYGLGIRKLNIQDVQLIGHTGTIPGYSGIALHNDEKNYTIVVLSNLSVIDQTQIFADIQKVVEELES